MGGGVGTGQAGSADEIQRWVRLGCKGPNYSLKAEFSPKSVCVSKALLEHSPTYSFTSGLQLPSLPRQNGVAVTETIWPAKPKISTMWPFTESLLTDGPADGSGERNRLTIQSRSYLFVDSVSANSPPC